jgi:hypothetical protein
MCPENEGIWSEMAGGDRRRAYGLSRRVPTVIQEDMQNVDLSLPEAETSVLVGFGKFDMYNVFGRGRAQQTIPARFVP